VVGFLVGYGILRLPHNPDSHWFYVQAALIVGGAPIIGVVSGVPHSTADRSTPGSCETPYLWYTRPYLKARLIHSLKLIDEAAGIEEHKVWAVPKDEKHPEGVRYRLAYIPSGQKEPAVLYDNHPKGHHKHIRGQQTVYEFTGVESLLNDFRRDIEALK